MATTSPRPRRRSVRTEDIPYRNGVPPLRAGDRLTRAEFHRRYEACPEDVKFELIGGTVYMASPARRPHGKHWFQLAGAFGVYEERTPGIEGLGDVTTILGDKSEPQPDLALRIMPEFGGQSRTDEDEYVRGAPELLAQIAHSTQRLDLGARREDYAQAGVLEYLVVCIGEREALWFNLRTGRPLKPSPDGLHRSRVFPGLWIDSQALLDGDLKRLYEGVRRGLASPAHAAFVKKLEAARRKKK